MYAGIFCMRSRHIRPHRVMPCDISVYCSYDVVQEGFDARVMYFLLRHTLTQ